MSESFAELFEESFASQQIKPGSIITGTVVAVNDDVVIVSAGLKSEAVKARSLLEMKSKSRSMPLKTASVRPSFPVRKRSAHVPGLSLRRLSKQVKLSKA
jgi:ribosomal protein S1